MTTLPYRPLSRDQMAWRAAQDLPEGAYVNLGIGIPTLTASYVPKGREVIFHSENGVLGLGPKPAPGKEDPNLIDAGKGLTTLVTGGAYVHHADAFLMIRGGHLDISLLGAFEVSETGDLANWTTDDPQFPPGVGGAMDLAVGAKQIRVLMEHNHKERHAAHLAQLFVAADGCWRCQTDLYEPRGDRRDAGQDWSCLRWCRD